MHKSKSYTLSAQLATDLKVWCHSNKILKLAAEQQILKECIKHYNSALIFYDLF